MSREKALLTTRHTLLTDFGCMDDLPRELANTIANIYFRYWSLPDEPDKGFTSIKDSMAEAERIARIQTEFEFVKKVVPEIRKLQQQAHPSLVAVASEMFVSILKYRIDDAVEKSPLRLKFERFLRRDKVDEIPGLLEALQLHKGSQV